MPSASDVEELLIRIDSLPYGPEERALLRRALDIVAELDDPDLEYRVRMRHTSSAFMGGDTEGMLTSFPWCLAWHDIDPERFPAQVDNDDLLWQFKWMSGVLATNPRFALDRVDETVADMERHYREAGVGLSGVWQARFSNALETGHYDAAAEFQRQREAIDRDEYSHCDACVRSETVQFQLETGDIPGAIETFTEIIDGQFSCGEEPERVQGHMLLTLLRTGAVDEAVMHHQQALRAAKAGADPFSLVLPHIPFLVVTGNLGRAFDLAERYLPSWGSDDINLVQRFDAACAFGVLADALVAAGHGDIVVRGTDHPDVAGVIGAHNSPLTAAAFSPAAWRVAEDLAARFDERNGTDRFARRLQASRDLADEQYDVPLGDPGVVRVPEPAATRTATDLLDRGRIRRYLDSDPHGALADVRAGLETAEGETRRSLLSDQLGLLLDLEQPPHEAFGAWLGALAQQGDHARAAMYERLGLAFVSREPGIDVSEYLSSDDPSVRGGALAYVLYRHTIDEQADAAGAAYNALMQLSHPSITDTKLWAQVTHMQVIYESMPREAKRIASSLAQHPAAWVSAVASVFLARMHGRDGEFAEGVPHAARVFRLASQLGVPGQAMGAAALEASLLADDERLDEAISRQRVAVRLAQLAGSFGHEAALRYQLGHWLMETGEVVDAADQFEATARLETEADVAAEALAETTLMLAIAARNFDPTRAYVALRRAEELASGTDEDELKLRVALAFGQFLFQFDDPDCVEKFDEAVRLANSSVPPALPTALHWLGRGKCATGDAAGLHDLQQARDLEAEQGNEWGVADVTDSTGRALLSLDRPDEAIATLLGAADLYAQAGDQGAAAGSELLAARVLRQNERADDAVAAYAAAFARPQSPEQKSAIGMEFAELLDDLGDHERSAQVHQQSRQ